MSKTEEEIIKEAQKMYDNLYDSFDGYSDQDWKDLAEAVCKVIGRRNNVKISCRWKDEDEISLDIEFFLEN
jgi:hypothetical protein